MSCTAERNVARRQAAKEFLAAKGVYVKVASESDVTAGWTVSGFLGRFSSQQLVDYAVTLGFDAEAGV